MLGFSVLVFVSLVLPLQATAKGYDRTVSFVCQDQKITSPGQILCCDTAPASSCQETLEKYVKPERLKALSALIDKILAHTSNNLIVQNCFRTALEIAEVPVTSTSASIGPNDFMRDLETTHNEIFDGSLEPNDVLVFEERGDYRYWYENELGNGKIFEVLPGSMVNHAAVYLGDGLILQKENTFSAVVSVTQLDRSHGVYELFAQKSIEKQFYVSKDVQLYTRVFRRK